MAIFVNIRAQQQLVHDEFTRDVERRVIFLRVGRVVRRVFWTSGTLRDLQIVILREFNAPKALLYLRSKTSLKNPFILTHSEFATGYVTAFPLVWPDADLKHGSVVSVKDPLWQAVCLLCARNSALDNLHDDDLSAASGRSAEESVSAYDGDPSRWTSDHGDMPRRLVERIEEAAMNLRSNLGSRERVHLLLNEPETSVSASVISVFVLILIVISTLTFCLETLPEYYTAETELSNPFWVIECVCIVFFTLEFVLRAWATPARLEFWRSGMNWIDFVAIIPFYIDIAARGSNIPGLSVLRVLRLARVFRLLKVSKNSVSLLAQTMMESARPLYILAFILIISLVMFSSLLYYAERGVYDAATSVWMRTVGFECDYECSPETRKLASAFVNCDADGDPGVMFLDRHTHGRFADACRRVREQSPYQSILHSAWWSVVTMATVGYGDLSPRSLFGQLLGGLTMLSGILVIALPITVVGSNFSSIYAKLGSRQWYDAKEHAPTDAVAPERLHATSHGSSTKFLAHHWLNNLAQTWDIDLRYTELLPCTPAPKRKAAGKQTSRSLEDDTRAFLKGNSLKEPESERVRGSSARSTEKLSAVASEAMLHSIDEDSDGSRRGGAAGNIAGSTLGSKRLGHALRGEEGERSAKRSGSGPGFESAPPPRVARLDDRLRRQALVAIVSAHLADPVQNVELKDKLSADLRRAEATETDALFAVGEEDATPPAGAAVGKSKMMSRAPSAAPPRPGLTSPRPGLTSPRPRIASLRRAATMVATTPKRVRG